MSTPFKTYQFHSTVPGPHLLVFGAIHGNEPCGTLGIEYCAKLIEEKWITLKSGCLTMIPVCNPDAFAKKSRFAEKNLNRVFKKHLNPDSYEEVLANELTDFVDRCDYLLDLHSQSSAGTPFVFQDYDDAKTAAFACAIGAGIVMKGWPEMYADMTALNDGDTVSYAHEKGKTAVVLECGQHQDPHAPGIAYKAIINSLIHLGMIEAPEILAEQQNQIVRGMKVFAVPKEGGHLVQKWKNLEDISKGQELAISNSGESIIAPYDGIIILPEYAAKPGAEWFYIGKREA